MGVRAPPEGVHVLVGVVLDEDRTAQVLLTHSRGTPSRAIRSDPAQREDNLHPRCTDLTETRAQRNAAETLARFEIRAVGGPPPFANRVGATVLH